MTDIARSYTAIVRRLRVLVLVLWAIIAAVSAVYVPRLFGATSLDFQAPKGSEAREAKDVLLHHFGEYSRRGSLVVVLRSRDGRNVVANSDARNATFDFLKGVQTDKDSSFALDFLSYHTLAENPMLQPIAEKKFVSSNKTSCMIQVVVADRHTPRANRYVRRLGRVVDNLKDEYPALEVYRTGQDWALEDFMSAAAREMIVMDSVSTAVALVVLVFMLRSATLLVVPLLNLLVSALLSLALLYVIAVYSTVAGFDPAIMLAVLIAMAVDYSLFLLKRYRQELDGGRGNDEAVTLMLTHAGRVVLVSGTTLTMSFLGLNFSGIDFLRTMGGGAAIAVVCTMLSNLTLTPALLLTFPVFFGTPGVVPCVRKCRRVGKQPTEDSTVEDNAWSRIARITTTTEGSAIVLTLVGMALLPSLYACKFFQTSVDNSLMFPADLPSSRATDVLSREFSAGLVTPFYFVAVSRNGNSTVLSPEYFATSQRLAHELVRSGTVADDDVMCISRLYGEDIPIEVAVQIIENNLMDPVSALYRKVALGLMQGDRRGALCMVSVKFDPSTGNSSRAWIAYARGLARDATEAGPERWYLSGDIVDEIDACDSAYGQFALMVGITSLIMVTVVALAFRSLLLPLRLAVTVGLTAASTFGVAVIVYCTPALEWVSAIPQKNIFWFPPLLVLFVIIGLGIDYDVFLFSRVTEYYARGFSPDEAIVLGCQHTGGVITGAGAVMAVAFSGLMMSHDPMLQEIGVFLVVAVLLDTFVIRLLVC
eukprot:m51a1_g14303 hypothetical protein (763) ;mRNA; r:448556-451318